MREPTKIAFVHDWLVTFGGAERVLEQMLACLPGADVFALVDFLPERDRGFLNGKRVRTSFLQALPMARSKYRNFLPLMPLAVEQFELAGYDLVVSSSFAAAKGIITGPDQLHLCMCYSPARYAWDLQGQYLKESGLETGIKGWLARRILKNFRTWDAVSSSRPDEYIAISHYIKRRIEKCYRRRSTVIYPPVAVESFLPGGTRGEHYFTASRMVPYKKLPLIVEAFRRMPDKKLIVVGDGPDFNRAKAAAASNVVLLGHRPFAELKANLQSARAFIFAAEEDFGIAPLEAQACGTPVIAYSRGAATETIRGLEQERPTGVFFDEQTPEAIAAAVQTFEANTHRIRPEACRENAMRFSPERFRAEFTAFVNEHWRHFVEARP